MTTGAQAEQGPEKKQDELIFSINSKNGPDGQLIDGGKLKGNFQGSVRALSQALTAIGDQNEPIKLGIINAGLNLMEEDFENHLLNFSRRKIEELRDQLNETSDASRSAKTTN